MPRKASIFHRMARLPSNSVEVRARGGRGSQESWVKNAAAPAASNAAAAKIQTSRLFRGGGGPENANMSGTAGLTGAIGRMSRGRATGSGIGGGPAGVG